MAKKEPLQNVQMVELEKIASDSGKGQKTPQQKSNSKLNEEVDKESEFEKATKLITSQDLAEQKKAAIPTEGKDESCDKTQLLEELG